MRSAESPGLPAALARAAGALSTAAMERMEVEVAWFPTLSAEDRSWVSLTVHAGIQGFIEWLRSGASSFENQVASSVFGVAPRELTGVISLQQTVDLIRITIDIVEAHLDDLVSGTELDEGKALVSRYAREVAFATALIYARAAEVRGAWDARLEALVVDSVLRAEADDELLSRASALGWRGHGEVAVVLGTIARGRSESDLFDDVRRRAGARSVDALCAAQGDRLVVILGGTLEPVSLTEDLIDLFDEGPVVVGPVVAGLGAASVSARSAMSAFRAAAGWPDAPRPIRSADLLPERALAGDGHARRYLIDEVYQPLTGKRTLEETLTAYFGSGSSIESAARALFVHPNTVRYRLGQVAEVTGYLPQSPRGSFTLQVALVLGRLSPRSTSPH